MTKRLVDIDDELLAQARIALGTTTMKETVSTALREAVDLVNRRAHVLRLIDDGLPDLRDPEIVQAAWR
ncbi:MAG TPA: type II toxin-antitoxin system VapB family antitoxin [Mycobacteriales bacterium]|jgi:Arc/MetJ family transcription regulator|nr:type II toxin-antitoxin system VapB family antitoxin [Mycobacteriales bacterium]